jgi:hypothetical protein
MHPEVRAKLQPGIEPNQEMLSARLDQRDRVADEHLGSGSGLARAHRDHRPPQKVQPKPGSRSIERVALRHAGP